MTFKIGHIERLFYWIFLFFGIFLFRAPYMCFVNKEFFECIIFLLLALLCNSITIYLALRTFDYLFVNDYGVKGLIHKSFHIKPVSFDIPWNDITKVTFAPGTKLRFVLTIYTKDNVSYEICSDNIGKTPERLLETILLYQYVHLEHYWKEVSINDKDLIEYYHCIKNEVNGKYSCYFEPLTPMAFNNDILDSTWKEYLLSRKYNIKHILNVSNSLLKHILKRSYNIEFVDFIIRTTVFCLVQDMQYKEAREKLKLLSNTPINKKYIEAELKYIEKSECTF